MYEGFMLSQGLTGEATRLIHREELSLETKGTRKLLSSLRPHGPETPSSASVPKVGGSNPRLETKRHEEVKKGITAKVLMLER